MAFGMNWTLFQIDERIRKSKLIMESKTSTYKIIMFHTELGV